MKILYGVCGVGFGHSSRAKEIITHLEKQGHEVLVITYGQAYKILKKFNTIKTPGIQLYFKGNKLLTKITIYKNLSIIKRLKLRSLIKKVNKFSPDVCISDMEPLVPIISFWKKLPLISVDNQHRLTHIGIKVPAEYQKDYLFAKTFVNRCISKAEAFVILSFTKSRSKNKNTYIVNPIIRKDITKLKPKRQEFILVYQAKPDEKLMKLLMLIPEKFVVYGYNKEIEEENIKFKKSGENFIYDLAKCKAVIATAGFTLMSESLYLKKPYFAIPLKSHFEQTLNALFLKNSKLGTFSENPTKKGLLLFLNKLRKYENNLKKIKFNPNEATEAIDKILLRINKK